MSTVAEIESAIEKLPIPQQEEIFAFLAQRIGIGKRPVVTSGGSDPLEALIGAYEGPREAAGRQVFTGSNAIDWWRKREHMSPEEGEEFARDVEAVRRDLNMPPKTPEWE
jgi:hypothetical protein